MFSVFVLTLILVSAMLALLPWSMLKRLSPPSPEVPGLNATASVAYPAETPSTTVVPTVRALATTPAPYGEMARVLNDRRLTYEPNWYAPEVQAFLERQPGPLKTTELAVGDRTHSFAEVLVSQTSLYSLNPKVVLTLLELQSRAVSDLNADLQWLAGYRSDTDQLAGIQPQLAKLVRELHRAQRDFPQRAALTFIDGSASPAPSSLTLAEYALSRALAPTVRPDELALLLGDGPGSFLATYTRLFDDPRLPPSNLPPPAAPFMVRPTGRPVPIESFFDHDAPFLQENGALTSYWNQVDADIAYDGHDGWDYAMQAPATVQSAAPGTVVFAGNSDDGCGIARAVIVDHDNGYRSLYWHLSSVEVTTGQLVRGGDVVGIVGATGCVVGEHLHFQAQYLGRDTDPYGWCGSGTDPWAAHPAGGVSSWLWADRPSPCADAPKDAVLIDAGTPGFLADKQSWSTVAPGYGGTAMVARSRLGSDAERPWVLRDAVPPAVAIWQPQLPRSGRYRVLAYIPPTMRSPDGLNEAVPYRWSSTARQLLVRYLVRHNDGISEVSVDQGLLANDWADLGVYSFDPASRPYVALSALANQPDFGVRADALLWLPQSD
jgi:murein DD-endopeptidase MepM/ murein hydrolase activator NlpD